jgi:flagellar motor switch protein FliN/FliY
VVLDRAVHEPADVLVNGKVVARGEVVVVDGAYGIRVSSIEKTEV